MYKNRMEDYEVTSDGIVISYKQNKDGKELSQCMNARGYYHVMISGVTTTVHRLVAWKYCEGYKEGFTVNHIDGDKLNNNADNLEWIKVKDNCIHAMKYISTKRRLYSDDEIRDIRSKFKLWKSNKDRRYTSYKLAEAYGVSAVTIMNIINGNRYKYIK